MRGKPIDFGGVIAHPFLFMMIFKLSGHTDINKRPPAKPEITDCFALSQSLSAYSSVLSRAILEKPITS